MAKPKPNTGVQNKMIYSRASYLYQVANYLASCGNDSPQSRNAQASETATSQQAKQHKSLRNLSRQALRDMRAVSLKAQIRQGSSVKHTICKFCDTLLVEGRTSRSAVENRSKGGRKPWADALVVTCNTCGSSRRYPVSAPRQPRRTARLVEPVKAQEQQAQEDAAKVCTGATT